MRKAAAAMFVCAFLGNAVPIYADPVTVTGGRLSGSDSSITDFGLTWPGFTLTGFADSSVDPLPNAQCEPCAPGFAIDLSVTFDQLDAVALNDAPLPGASGQFTFTSAMVPVPVMPPDSNAQISHSFAFAGQLAWTGGALDLTGQGIATLFLRNNAGEGINATRIDYVFQDPAAVPEPATLLLVGGGIAGLLARRRSRAAAN